MDGKLSYISRSERLYLCSLAGVLVLFVYGEFISDAVQNYNWAIREEQAMLSREATGIQTFSFGMGPPADFGALFHLGSLLLFLALIFGRKFYFALLLTVAYLSVVLFGIFLLIVSFAGRDVGADSFFDYLTIGLKGLLWDPLNLLAIGILPTLLIWEIRIVSRIMRQTLKSPNLA